MKFQRNCGQFFRARLVFIQSEVHTLKMAWPPIAQFCIPCSMYLTVWHSQCNEVQVSFHHSCSAVGLGANLPGGNG